MNSSVEIDLQAGQKVSEFCPLVESPTTKDYNETLSTTCISIACSTISTNDIKADLEHDVVPS